MNTYKIRVNNAEIIAQGIGEYQAIKNLCLFKDAREIEAVKRADATGLETMWAWIYEVELNGMITLAYVTREV